MKKRYIAILPAANVEVFKQAATQFEADGNTYSKTFVCPISAKNGSEITYYGCNWGGVDPDDSRVSTFMTAAQQLGVQILYEGTDIPDFDEILDQNDLERVKVEL